MTDTAPITGTAAAGEPLPPWLRLVEIVSGGWIASAVSVLADLGVADQLDVPRTAADLAGRVGADPDALTRFLRAGCAAGVLRPDGPDAFALTDVGAVLRSDAVDGMREMCRLTGRPEFAATWAHAGHTARTGRSAFAEAQGAGLWEYMADPGNAAFARLFHGAMSESAVRRSVLLDHDLGPARHVVDVGGGRGTQIAELLAERPELHGTVVDLPEAVRGADRVFADAGVADRATAVAGSFFEEVPAGADIYLMCRVLGNWDDEHCVRILRTVRAAMTASSRLVVVGHMPGDDDRTGYTRALDLYMFVMLEARLRTPDEHVRLFAEAGLELAEVARRPDTHSLIVARPV